MNIQITAFETLVPKADTEWAPAGTALLCAQVQGPWGLRGFRETHFEDLTLGLVQRGVWSGHWGYPFTVKGVGRRPSQAVF